jgi:integrase
MSNQMNYIATIRKRRRGKSLEWTARLLYTDQATGRQKEKSRNASSKQDARTKLKQLEDEFTSGGPTAVESDRMTFSDLVAHCKENRYCDAVYDDEGRKLIGVRGKATVLGHMNALERFFGRTPLRDINVATLRAYRKGRLLTVTKRGTRLSVCTVNRELSTLRAMLNEAIVNDWLLISPFKRVRPGDLISIADERKRTTVLSFDEESRLLAACNTPHRRHLRAFIIAALDTGARRGELLKVRRCDVDFEQRVIHDIESYKGKTVDRRPVPLTDRLADALKDLLENPSIATFKTGRKSKIKPDHALVFGIRKTLQRSWEAAREDAGLVHVRLHDLRHTAATRMKKELPITDVGLILGHSDPRTTQRYVNRTPEVVQEAARVLNQFQYENERSNRPELEAETDSVN